MVEPDPPQAEKVETIVPEGKATDPVVEPTIEPAVDPAPEAASGTTSEAVPGTVPEVAQNQEIETPEETDADEVAANVEQSGQDELTAETEPQEQDEVSVAAGAPERVGQEVPADDGEEEPEAPEVEGQEPETPEVEGQEPEEPEVEGQEPEEPEVEGQEPEGQEPEEPEVEGQEPEGQEPEGQDEPTEDELVENTEDVVVDLSVGGGALKLCPGEGYSGISTDLDSHFSISHDGYGKIEYLFSENIEGITRIGDRDVTFRVGDKGLKLYAILGDDGGEELIASIRNSADGSLFSYPRGNAGDALLNTGGMYVLIKAGTVLDSGTVVGVTFDGQDQFKADIVRPVDISPVSSKPFIDGVDFGEEGSYISIADLISPVDWRGRNFSDHPNYWGYYGVQIGSDPNNYGFQVIVNTDDVQCEITGQRQDIYPGMFVFQVDPLTTPKTPDGKSFLVTDPVRPSLSVKIPVNKFGYLIYFNNGRCLTNDFKIFVKAKIRYGFGYLDSGWIAVPVKRTI